MLATPGERGVIGRGQSETQHPEDRRQEAFSLPQGQVEDEPERQRGFDGEIGILPLPATFADPHGLPSGDRIRGQPHGDITSLDQRSVECRPIPDVVFCLVLWVHARLHVEIMHLLSPRWPGGRSWLTEGAGPCTNACAGKARSRGTRCRDVIFETLFETLWVSNPIRPRSAASRNRVMRGPGVTQGAKRSQGARRPRD